MTFAPLPRLRRLCPAATSAATGMAVLGIALLATDAPGPSNSPSGPPEPPAPGRTATVSAAWFTLLCPTYGAAQLVGARRTAEGPEARIEAGYLQGDEKGPGDGIRIEVRPYRKSLQAEVGQRLDPIPVESFPDGTVAFGDSLQTAAFHARSGYAVRVEAPGALGPRIVASVVRRGVQPVGKRPAGAPPKAGAVASFFHMLPPSVGPWALTAVDGEGMARPTRRGIRAEYVHEATRADRDGATLNVVVCFGDVSTCLGPEMAFAIERVGPLRTDTTLAGAPVTLIGTGDVHRGPVTTRNDEPMLLAPGDGALVFALADRGVPMEAFTAFVSRLDLRALKQITPNGVLAD